MQYTFFSIQFIIISNPFASFRNRTLWNFFLSLFFLYNSSCKVLGILQICYIKPLLVQCANTVLTSKKPSEIRNSYLRIKKHRGHKKAIIAIVRMLLPALYHLLKNGKNYNAELYQKSDLPPVAREITVEQAIPLARSQGYNINSATA